MINEIKFSKYLETGEQISELEINTFLKLYVNHKPVNGVTKGQIHDALRTLSGDQGIMNWDQFIDSLKARGERLDEKEVECKNFNLNFRLFRIFIASKELSLISSCK